MRFLCDAMCAKLARYLRCAGIDAAEAPEVSTATRIERANREERVFLTRNRRLLHVHPRANHWALVPSDDPVEQVRWVAEVFELDLVAHAFTRCVRCNMALVPVDRDSVRERVPPAVFERYAGFFTCPSCATVFWRGSHVRNTCRRLGIADVSEA